jgi:hypothetical protein
MYCRNQSEIPPFRYIICAPRPFPFSEEQQQQISRWRFTFSWASKREREKETHANSSSSSEEKIIQINLTECEKSEENKMSDVTRYKSNISFHSFPLLLLVVAAACMVHIRASERREEEIRKFFPHDFIFLLCCTFTLYNSRLRSVIRNCRKLWVNNKGIHCFFSFSLVDGLSDAAIQTYFLFLSLPSSPLICARASVSVRENENEIKIK